MPNPSSWTRPVNASSTSEGSNMPPTTPQVRRMRALRRYRATIGRFSGVSSSPCARAQSASSSSSTLEYARMSATGTATTSTSAMASGKVEDMPRSLYQ